jgi:hypothetical protein
MTANLAPPRSPIRVTGRFDPELSRGLWLVNWLLLIPHLIVLAVLGAVFWVLTVVAFFAILVTGRYPRVIFGFTTGVLRWGWRVAFCSRCRSTWCWPCSSGRAAPWWPASPRRAR